MREPRPEGSLGVAAQPADVFGQAELPLRYSHRQAAPLLPRRYLNVELMMAVNAEEIKRGVPAESISYPNCPVLDAQHDAFKQHIGQV